MGTRPPIFDLLLREDSQDADHALVAALPGADPITARLILQTVLARSRPVGLSGLVAHYHEMDENQRANLITAMPQVFRVLRESLQSRSEQVRRNVVELVARGRAYRAGYLLDLALHDRSPQLREAAAESLYALAAQFLATPALPPPSPGVEGDAGDLTALMRDLESRLEDRRQLVSALVELGAGPTEGGGVAFWAHVGGFVTGLLVAGAWRLLHQQRLERGA